MLMAIVMWAGAFIAGKLGTGELSPLMLTFFRFLFATMVIFPIMIAKEKDQWRIGLRDIIDILPLAIVGMIGYHMFFFTALRHTTATNASMINAINPLLTAILASILLKERLSGVQLLLILTALMGVILTVINWDIYNLIHFQVNIGDLIMFCGTSCWAVYSIMVKKVIRNFSPLKLTAYTFLLTIVLLLPSVLMNLGESNLSSIGSTTWLAVLYMSIFPTVIGYTIQQLAIKEIGPARTAQFINLVPFTSMILAFLFLGEPITILNIVSGLVIVSSVFLYTKVSQKSQAPIVEKA